jgi:N6-L-threonylcarbamoyladenine synthase
MGIMRWTVYNKLKEIYPDVRLTYGYITKNTRIKAGLPKDHHIDARCAGGYVPEEADSVVYLQKKVRRHNRQIHKANILKGNIKKLNQAQYLVKGFRLYDKVLFESQECFICGRRSTGYFDFRLLDGTSVHKSASWKKLILLEPAKTYLTERKMQVDVKPQE